MEELETQLQAAHTAAAQSAARVEALAEDFGEARAAAAASSGTSHHQAADAVGNLAQAASEAENLGCGNLRDAIME